jgi:hypothetical protein
MSVKVEAFSSPGCGKCAQAKEVLKAIIEELGKDQVTWRDVNASLGGSWVQKLLGREWGLVLGPLLIVLGLVWPGWIRLPLPALSFRAQRAATAWGAFALGVPFSIAVCPFCTPALAV